VDVARNGRLDDVVPFLPERLGEVGLGRDRPLPDQPLDRGMTFSPVQRSTPALAPAVTAVSTNAYYA
jgi:hypothetical protein